MGRKPIKIRVEELFAEMAPDFGELSGVDTRLLRQACLLLARSETCRNVRDGDVCLRMTGEARRILSALRRHAAPKPPGPSLYERLASAQSAGSDAAVDVAGDPDDAPSEAAEPTAVPSDDEGEQ